MVAPELRFLALAAMAATARAQGTAQVCTVPRLTDISGIVATCCQNQAQPDCSDGFPAGCSVACAQELVPYEAQCHTMLAAFGSGMGLGFDLRELSTYVVGPDRNGGACSHTLALRNAAQLNGGSACGDMSARSQAVTDACCVESGVYQCGSGAPWQCDAECAQVFIPYWVECLADGINMESASGVSPSLATQFRHLYSECEGLPTTEIQHLVDAASTRIDDHACPVDQGSIISKETTGDACGNLDGLAIVNTMPWAQQNLGGPYSCSDLASHSPSLCSMFYTQFPGYCCGSCPDDPACATCATCVDDPTGALAAEHLSCPTDLASCSAQAANSFGQHAGHATLAGVVSDYCPASCGTCSGHGNGHRRLVDAFLDLFSPEAPNNDNVPRRKLQTMHTAGEFVPIDSFETPQCRFRDFNDRVDQMTAVCCRTGHNSTCAGGLPTRCGFECGRLFQSFIDECHPVLQKWVGPDALREYVHFQNTCLDLDVRSIVMAIHLSHCNYCSAAHMPATDTNECDSNPCQNGANCTDSTTNRNVPTGAFRCTCADGYTNGLCNHYAPGSQSQCIVENSVINPSYSGTCNSNVNECASNPCANGATCSQGTAADSSAPGYYCRCVDGYANGVCSYSPIVPQIQQNGDCTVYASTTTTPGGGNCDVDVNECVSSPCNNGGTCHETTVSAWTCDCAPQWSGTSCDTEIDPCSASEDDCATNLADCVHTGPGTHTCTCHFGLTTSNSGQTCTDIDECSSSPCQHGGTCTQSDMAGVNLLAGNPLTGVPLGTYRCACTPGWADGMCAAGWNTYGTPAQTAAMTDQHQNLCTVDEGGTCSFDIDECASNPCQNGGQCTESSVSGGGSVNTFTCSCLNGFDGSTCQNDFDECASTPCRNGADCYESNTNNNLQQWFRLEEDVGIGSIPYDAYTCVCKAGYANGACDYPFIEAYRARCTVLSSKEYRTNGGHHGNCDTDVNECDSHPCQNSASCAQHVDAYTCTCGDGYTSGMCSYSLIVPQYADACHVSESKEAARLMQNTGFYGSGNCDIDVDECASDPCHNGATCYESLSGWTCQCAEGWTGSSCTSAVSQICAPSENDCSIQATCTHTASGTHTCQCKHGWQGDGNPSCTDIDECASNPCHNGGTCTESGCPMSSYPDQTMCNSTVPIGKYHCECTHDSQAGYADGTCAIGWNWYDTQLTEQFSPTCTKEVGGSCSIPIPFACIPLPGV